MSKFNAQSKFAAKQSTVAAKAPRVRRATTNAESVVADASNVFAERIAAAQDELLTSFSVPSSTRVLIATVTGLLAYAGTLYWTMSGVAWLTVAAATLTSSVFIGYLVLVLGWFFAIVASIRIGWKCAKFVLGYEIGDGMDATRSTKARVRSWFKRGAQLNAA